MNLFHHQTFFDNLDKYNLGFFVLGVVGREHFRIAKDHQNKYKYWWSLVLPYSRANRSVGREVSLSYIVSEASLALSQMAHYPGY